VRKYKDHPIRFENIFWNTFFMKGSQLNLSV
jgi:hypothetical protein